MARRRYFPCTVQWFLERCELQLIRKGWRRRVLQVVQQAGSLNGETLARAQEWFAAQGWKRRFLMLRLVDPAHRAGQPDKLNQVRQGKTFLQHPCASWSEQTVGLATPLRSTCVPCALHGRSWTHLAHQQVIKPAGLALGVRACQRVARPAYRAVYGPGRQHEVTGLQGTKRH
jgi:hypothetical protein